MTDSNALDWSALSSFIHLLGASELDSSFLSILERYSFIKSEYDEDLPHDFWYENPQKGIAILCTEGRVNTIFFMSEGKDGFSEYEDPLIGGLSFKSVREDVRKILGTPDVYKDELVDEEYGGWDKYILGEFSIHFSYERGTDKVELVTLIKGNAYSGLQM